MPRLAGAPGRARLRDRRRRRQGRRPGAAAQARLGRARSPLGGRLEVPADDRRHAPGEGHVERRQVRRHAPLRRARAGRRRRRADRHGHAAQRGGPRAQGPQAGRGGDRAARRRRDPAGRLAGAARGRAEGSPAAAEAAGQVPVLRHQDDQAGGGRVHEVPQPALPRSRVAAAQALRLAWGDGHRRPGGEAGRTAAGARPRHDGRRLLPPARGAAGRARGLRRAVGEQAAGGAGGLQGAAVRARAVRAGDRGGRRGHRAQPRPALPRDRRAAGARRPRRSSRRPGWGRRWPPRSASSSTTSACAR